jgi:N-acetylglucosamine-6-sulfatase
LPIPNKLEELKWPIRYQKNMKLLRSLAAVDESIGIVLKTLEELGELDNTVVIFSSDNGYFMGEHTFKDKRLAYENSMRVPMLIRYPKFFTSKSVISNQCLNIDVAPTILDIAGIQKPDYMQGESMFGLLNGEADDDWRKSFLFEYYKDAEWPHAGPNQVAVRTMEFKLVESFIKNDIDELYDLINDPGEMNNLINDARFNEKASELRLESLRLQKKYKYNPDRDWHLRTIVKNR